MKKAKKMAKKRMGFRPLSVAERRVRRENFRHRMFMRRQAQTEQTERFFTLTQEVALHSERQAVAFERIANALEKILAD